MEINLDKAKSLYAAGDFNGVRTILERYQLQEPLPLAGLLLLGQSYAKLDQHKEAAQCFSQAAKDPQSNPALLLSLALALLRKSGDDWAAFLVARDLHHLDPRHENAAYVYRHFIHHWLDMEEQRRSNKMMQTAFEQNDSLLIHCESPLNQIAWCGNEAFNRAATRIENATAFTEKSRTERRSKPHIYGKKPRIGYLSNDLSDCHATIKLMQGMFDCHDETALDFTFFCYSSDALIAADFNFRTRHAKRIVPIGHLTTEQAHDAIRVHGIDILVDLKGHTMGAWIDLVNSGPAPIQVAYIGFPGSGNGIDCDYILSDAIVTPVTSQPYYHEKFCLLPESYQPNDNRQRSLPPPSPRSVLNLPENRFIFNSSNTIRKITPETFDLWVEILKRTGNSILWMMGERPQANDNFLQSIAKAGVAPERVLFMSKTGYNDHLARLPAADLGLDTFPYNGHTTTSDCLWVGLPVLTKRGTTFASRVSESLLCALGVPELVAQDDQDFVDMAVRLANTPDELAALRQKINRQRFIAPLFDSERSARHVEAAFHLMVERAKQGLPPDHLAVAALPARQTPFGPKL